MHPSNEKFYNILMESEVVKTELERNDCTYEIRNSEYVQISSLLFFMQYFGYKCHFSKNNIYFEAIKPLSKMNKERKCISFENAVMMHNQTDWKIVSNTLSVKIVEKVKLAKCKGQQFKAIDYRVKFV
jgi:hypothetical protein